MEPGHQNKRIITHLDATCGASFKGAFNPDNDHFIFITDETGIEKVFNCLKAKIADQSSGCLTLVYALLNDETPPLFKAELLSLEKRFSSLLQIHFVYCESKILSIKASIQKTLEVILNSNINSQMHFFACGNAEIIERVAQILHFLGVRGSQITTEKAINQNNV